MDASCEFDFVAVLGRFLEQVGPPGDGHAPLRMEVMGGLAAPSGIIKFERTERSGRPSPKSAASLYRAKPGYTCGCAVYLCAQLSWYQVAYQSRTCIGNGKFTSELTEP